MLLRLMMVLLLVLLQVCGGNRRRNGRKHVRLLWKSAAIEEVEQVTTKTCVFEEATLYGKTNR
jgi:hypothetical protein